MTTVIEIVRAHLESNGFDGLYSPSECACKVDDLAPCGGLKEDCEPGYLQACDCGDHDWHIGDEKPATATANFPHGSMGEEVEGQTNARRA